MPIALHWLVALFFAMPAAVGAEPVKASPEGAALSVDPAFSFPDAKRPEKMRSSLSGIACPSALDLPHRCIAVFDEGAEARYVVIDGRRMLPERDRIVLLSGGNQVDAEGAARDRSFAFVTSSHSARRGACEANPDSRHVFRFGLDEAGRAQLDANGKPIDLVDDHGRLWNLMSANTVLGKFVGKCLGKDGHGVNIEGLAARNGQLYFGFREPAINKTTYILRVSADALFSGGDLSARLFTVEAGKASGIRDLLAVPEGLLLLIGPDDDSKNVPWRMAFWDSSEVTNNIVPRPLAELTLPAVTGKDCQKEMKPEALTVVEDGKDFRRVLILSDGMCDGGPLIFRIPK